MASVINMDISALRSFVLAENLGSFSAAANGLHCSQSALSLRIKKLEEQLGCELFHRNYHTLKLTADGAMLLPEAVKVLAGHDAMIQVAQNNGSSEMIRLGIPEDMTAGFFHNFLATHEEYVDKIELSMHLCRDLVQMLCEGELDIALINAMPDYQGGEAIASRELKWVCAPGFEYQPEQPLPLALHPEGCIFREHVFKTLNALGRAHRVTFSAQGSISVQAAVSAGMGLSVMAEGIIPDSLVEAPNDWRLPALGQADIRIYQMGHGSPFLADFIETLRHQLPKVM
ncbi:LysR family transcriptional regulator [Aliamphritea ceti]|uniref:LysR family transcriptional regulator n=1 Tax=Aliamphritea ceti TaxID=1524258 RepID=UPI0021C48958|nr:LysR family transcriptional regulator [Aliamphritea ceti]